MRRFDRALEVWHKRKLVGWLTDRQVDATTPKTIKVSHCVVAFDEDEDLLEERVFTLIRRRTEIESVILERTDDRERVMHARRIPRYANSAPVYIRDAMAFEWPVLQANEEEFDWLFDLPAFEPANHPEEDLEQKRETLLSDIGAQLSRAMDNAIMGTLTGRVETFASTTNAIAASANDSSISVEKLQEQMKLIANRYR